MAVTHRPGLTRPHAYPNASHRRALARWLTRAAALMALAALVGLVAGLITGAFQ